MSFARNVSLFLWMAAGFFSSGCSMFGPIQAYDGASLPASQTATLTVAPYTTGPAQSDSYGTIKSIRVDGKSYGTFMGPDDYRDVAYSIQAGTRVVSVDYEQGTNNCGISTDYNYYIGLSSSPVKHECNPKDINRSVCKASFSASSGRRYEYQVTSHYAEYADPHPKVDVEVVDKGAGDKVIGQGACMKR